MKQIYTLPVILICVGLFNACKKKELPEAEPGNDPQFYFRGDINGGPVILEAGVNDYYMYSSYWQSSTNGCYGFGAQLKKSNCSTCSNSIKIEINDYKNSAMNGPSFADSAFVPTCYPYYTAAPAAVSYQLTFFPLWSGAGGVSYLWNFGDGSTSTLASPTHTFMRPGEYSVSLTATDTNSCSSTIVNVQKLGITDNICNTTLSVSTSSSLNTTFSHTSTGVGTLSYNWDFGDGNFSTQAFPSHTYANQGLYPVKLQVTDSKGDVASARFNYSTQNNTICAVNYIILNKYPMPNPGAWSNIVVKWYDSNGIEYTSNSSSQPASSYFRIISSEDYHNNESGQKTKKLRVRFNCTVYNGTSSMLIENADAVVVVAYK